MGTWLQRFHPVGNPTNLAIEIAKLWEGRGAGSVLMLGEIAKVASRRAQSVDSPRSSSVFPKLEKLDLGNIAVYL